MDEKVAHRTDNLFFCQYDFIMKLFHKISNHKWCSTVGRVIVDRKVMNARRNGQLLSHFVGNKLDWTYAQHNNDDT